MIEQLNAVLQQTRLENEIQGASVEVNSRIITTHEGLLNEARAFADSESLFEGWLCLTDEVMLVDKNFDFSEIKGRTVLSGELAGGERSLHIRQWEDGWILSSLTRKNGGNQFMVEEKFISTRRPLKLRYETYWQEKENCYGQRALQPLASRFSGFERGGESIG